MFRKPTPSAGPDELLRRPSAAKSMVARLTRAAASFSRAQLLLMLLLAGMVTAHPAALLAQSDNSSIAGMITDPSGAVVGAAAGSRSRAS